MARPHREATNNLDRLVKLYFEAHPEKQARNDAINRAQGTEALWVTPSDMPTLVEWARALQYISTEQGQFLMTTARRLENTYSNPQW